MGLEPLLGVHLVGAQDRAHLVVEDLGRGARQGAQPGVHQAKEVLIEWLAESLRAFGDFERGEAVHVDVGRGFLHRPAHVDVVVAVEVGMDAALQAHLGRAERGGLGDALLDVFEREEVGRAAQVQRQRALREAAEAALERADVRVVDVAVVHPRDDVADRRAAKVVGDLGDGHDLGAACAEERDELVDPGLLPEQHAVEHLAHRAARPCDTGHQDLRVDVGTRVPRGRAVTDDLDVGSLVGPAHELDALGEHRARVVAAEPLGVGTIHHREHHRGVEPPGGIVHVLGVDREARREREALGLGDLAQPVERGPRPLGVHVVGRHRRHTAPVVDACVEQHPEVVGEVRRRLDVDLGREDDAGHGDRPEVLVARARGGEVHRGAGLRQEVLDDHLLHVAVLAMGRRDRLERDDAVGSGLADADEDAGREGDLEDARGVERRETSLWRLVGRAAVAVEVVAQ